MKTLKSISTFILLVTGIITATMGALQSVIKFMETIRPEVVVEKSIEMLPDTDLIIGLDGPDSYFSIGLGGTELILIGVILIITAIILHKTR